MNGMEFERRVLAYIQKNRLMSPRRAVLVGISGGADSMALGLCLLRLRHELGVPLHAAHFNHRQRPEAGRDERFVSQWCERWRVPLAIGRRTGGTLKKLPSEDSARQMRLEFLIQTARRLKAQSVALAHTQSDLAETVLMRLIRGSGLLGLRAILPRRSIDGVVFVRPLLGQTRRDIEDYLETHHVAFCTDTTNRKPVYQRNKVRLQLMPLLAREYNPRITEALADLAATAAQDYDFLSAKAHEQFQKSVVKGRGRAKVDLAVLRLLHPAIRRLVLREMAQTLRLGSSLDFEHIHALEQSAFAEGQAAIDLPGGLKAVKTGKFLQLRHG